MVKLFHQRLSLRNSIEITVNRGCKYDRLCTGVWNITVSAQYVTISQIRHRYLGKRPLNECRRHSFNGRFPSRYQNSPFWISFGLRMKEEVMITGAVRRAKLHSSRHHQKNDTQLFTGRMPFMSPNQQCQSTEGKRDNTTKSLSLSLSLSPF